MLMQLLLVCYGQFSLQFLPFLSGKLQLLLPALKRALRKLGGGIRIDPLCVSLVLGGKNDPADAAEKFGAEIVPVDSEHSAIFQCLEGNRNRPIKKILLTASGGPFRGFSREQLAHVTLAQALRHPTWKMGPKITVDCATLMNKGLEVIEAARLYDLDADRVRVVVHPESIIHSMVEYTDNAVLAQLAVPDMRSCISYALHYPHRGDAVIERLDLTSVGSLSFFKPDTETFSRVGGTMPAILNAANECAVGHFLRGEVGSFTDIFDLVGETVAEFSSSPNPSIDDIISADLEARRAVERRLSL